MAGFPPAEVLLQSRGLVALFFTEWCQVYGVRASRRLTRLCSVALSRFLASKIPRDCLPDCRSDTLSPDCSSQSFDFSLVYLWFPSCPLLLSLSFRKTFCLFFVQYSGMYGVVVPPCPRPDIIANVHFIISSPWSNVVFVREGRFFCPSALGTCRCGLNSIIPYHISFLKPSGSLSYACQRKGPYLSFSSSMSFSSAHIIPNSTLRSPVMLKSLAPPRRPSRRTFGTLEKKHRTSLYFYLTQERKQPSPEWFQRELLYISLQTSRIS